MRIARRSILHGCAALALASAQQAIVAAAELLMLWDAAVPLPTKAAAPVLDSFPFYQHCRRLLTEQGCITVNLFGRASSFERSVEKISAAFGAEAVWAFKPTREGNTVVLAQHSRSRPRRELLLARAAEIEQRWGLPAAKWVRGLKAMQA